MSHRLYKSIFWASAFAAVLLGVTAANAQRAKPRLVVFPVSSAAEDPDSMALAGALTKVLVREGKARSMRVTTAQASFNDTALIAGCDGPSNDCFQRLLDQLSADQGIVGSVQPSDNPEAVTVEIFYFRRDAAPVQKTVVVQRSQADSEFTGVLPELLGKYDDSQDTEPGPGAGTGADAVVSGADSAGTAPVADSIASGRGAWMPWAVAGSGGVLMGTGAAFWLLSRQEQAYVDDAPTSSVEDLEFLERIEANGRRHATIGNVLFVSGLAVTAAGVAWAVVRNKKLAASEKGASLTVAPVPVKGGVGLALSIGWSP